MAKGRGLRGSDLLCYTTIQDTRTGTIIFVKSNRVSDKKGPMVRVNDLRVCEGWSILLVILCSVGESGPSATPVTLVCMQCTADQLRQEVELNLKGNHIAAGL
jgi:hypothetical protein